MIDLFVTLSVWDSIYGALSTMMQPIYWAISGLLVLFYWVWGTWLSLPSGVAWALAIVSLTVVARTAMIPLFVKQINSSRNMQLLQPKMQELQKKYAADRERLGQETMKLYKEEGVNPMASCFPLLIQMPIFLGLFRVLQGAADGTVRGSWLRDRPDLVESLQGADLWGAMLSHRILPFFPVGPTQIMGIVLVVLMVGALLVTQLQMMGKNMPPAALQGPMAQQQKMMLYIFPVIYAVSSTFIPVGVLLYWFASNLWTLGQQTLLIRNNPAPDTPAYIDWEERMRAKGKDPDEIIRERREKRRGKKTKNTTSRAAKYQAKAAAPESDGATDVATTEVAETPRVQRQQVSRPTVRTDADGRRVVTRRQPQAKSRAQRKKK